MDATPLNDPSLGQQLHVALPKASSVSRLVATGSGLVLMVSSQPCRASRHGMPVLFNLHAVFTGQLGITNTQQDLLDMDFFL